MVSYTAVISPSAVVELLHGIGPVANHPEPGHGAEDSAAGREKPTCQRPHGGGVEPEQPG